MAIRFRCPSCSQLLSIASRKAGQVIECPVCQALHAVPYEDQLEPARPRRGEATKVDETQPESSDETRYLGTDAGAAAPQVAAMAVTDDDIVEESFGIRRPDTELDELDLTPMVDVTFLLLIFFMITAQSNLQKALEFPPPTPNERGAVQTVQNEQQLLATSILVEIDDQNVIYVDQERLGESSDLVDMLLDRMQDERKTELLLKADSGAMHETVVKVVDAANEVGMQKIRLATSGSGNT